LHSVQTVRQTTNVAAFFDETKYKALLISYNCITTTHHSHSNYHVMTWNAASTR